MTPKNPFLFINFFDAEVFQNNFVIKMCVIRLPIKPYITRDEKIFRDVRVGQMTAKNQFFFIKLLDAEFFQNDFDIKMCVIKLPIQPYITHDVSFDLHLVIVKKLVF